MAPTKETPPKTLEMLETLAAEAGVNLESLLRLTAKEVMARIPAKKESK